MIAHNVLEFGPGFLGSAETLIPVGIYVLLALLAWPRPANMVGHVCLVVWALLNLCSARLSRSSGMLIFFGATFACFGAAVTASRRFRWWFGYVAVVGAGGSAVAAVLQIAASGEVQAAETIFLGGSLFLTLWTLALGVWMWRGHANNPAGAPSLA